MRARRDQLAFRALVVLDEAVDACHDAPIRPSLGHRLALMVLYAISDGDRKAYDAFWRTVQDREDHGQSASVGRAMRGTGARTCLTTIARGVGIDFSADYQRELRIARMSPGERRAHREREAKLAEHRRRLREDGWQYEAGEKG